PRHVYRALSEPYAEPARNWGEDEPEEREHRDEQRGRGDSDVERTRVGGQDRGHEAITDRDDERSPDKHPDASGYPSRSRVIVLHLGRSFRQSGHPRLPSD